MVKVKKNKNRHPDSSQKTAEYVPVNGNSDDRGVNADTLIMQVREENEFVKRLVNCISPDVYFGSESLSKIRDSKRVRMDIQMNETGFSKTGTNLSNKARHKRMKLDPEQHENVMQIIQNLATAEKSSKKKKDKKHTPQINMGIPATSDELKARLEAKIALLRGGKATNVHNKTELRKMKRRLSKLKLKQRRKQLSLSEMQPTPKEKAIKSSTKPVFNKEGKMVFSKFDFTESEPDARKKGEYSGKNYKKLLKKVEKDESKIKQLEESDDIRAQHVKEKKKWKAAFERAEGMKVKDNPDLLKKAAKRQEKRKKKSKKEWSSRIEAVKKKQEMKQKKRKENIDAKKKEKVKKKIKLAVKKGRLVPGFF